MSELFDAEADPPSLRFWDLHTPWLPNADSAATGILVIITGKFGVGFLSDISTLTNEEIQDVKASFEDAMAEHLKNILPKDAEISITSISTVGSSSRRKLLEQVVVDYKCEMHLDIDDDAKGLVDSFDESLSDKLQTLQDTVKTELSGSNYTAVTGLEASCTIESHTLGTHTISHLMKWYPDWLVSIYYQEK